MRGDGNFIVMAVGQGPQQTAITIGLGVKRVAVQPKGITARQWAQSIEHRVCVLLTLMIFGLANRSVLG